MKVAIIGSRKFQDYDLLKEVMSEIPADKIVSGGAKGADILGERYARENNIPCQVFYADWGNLNAIPCKVRRHPNGQAYNLLAGFNRNKLIVENSDLIVAFHINHSPGTADTIKYAEEKGVKTIVIQL